MERFYNRFIIATLCFTALYTSPAFAASDLEGGVKDLAEQISKNMAASNKKKIAVVDFSDLDGNVTALGQFLAEDLITQLFMISPGQFEVVERRQLLKLEKELLLSQTGFIEEKSIKKMGQVFGVDAIVTGSITDLGNTIKVNARLIGVESAKVFAVAATKIPKVGIVEKLMAKAAASTPVLTPSSSQASVQTSSSESANNPQTDADRRAAKEKAKHERRVAAGKAAAAEEKEMEAACPAHYDSNGMYVPAGYRRVAGGSRVRCW